MPIFDQGYQHWSGQLAGHAWRWLAITRQGIRSAAKKRFSWLFVRLAWLPAILLAIVLCLWGMIEQQSDWIIPYIKEMRILPTAMLVDPRSYRVEVWSICYYYFLRIEIFISFALLLIIGPDLISQDLRYNALPLYLSRPLRRIDYFLGKLGVIAYFLGLIIIVPSLIAYVLGLLFSLDISILRDTLPVLAGVLLTGVIVALSMGTLMLAFSSLTRNSRLVGLFWFPFIVGTAIVSTILVQVDQQQKRYAVIVRTNQEIQELQAELNKVKNQDDAFSQSEQATLQSQIDEKTRNRRSEARAEGAKQTENSWRPTLSYFTNLNRISQQLLNTNASWEKFGKLIPDQYGRQTFLSIFAGPQFPWTWSAYILLGLFGISTCILQGKIKSLDRLK
jgi:ABC-2 type transport system permease protein